MAVEMNLRYAGQLRTELTHGPSKSTIQTDAPTDNMGKGEAFSPTDLVGAALLSCVVTTLGIKAPAEGVTFGTASGRVKKHMTTEGPRRVAKLELEIDMPPGIPPEKRPAMEAIARGCPVARSLSSDLVQTMTFRYP